MYFYRKNNSGWLFVPNRIRYYSEDNLLEEFLRSRFSKRGTNRLVTFEPDV